MQSLSKQVIFWLAWIIIPIIMEIIPAIFNFFVLIRKRWIVKRKYKELPFYPQITLIIPVYNSAQTLRGCLQSIEESDYDSQFISIMLVNNGSTDDSFAIYQECQERYPNLTMQWLNAKQGKSKALNMALFNATGKYVVHIDSDGQLERSALKNLVLRFENNSHIHCMTGTIMVDPRLIEKTEKPLLKLLQKCEFCEYAQDFLVGRNYESEFDSVFTLSGAFSAFRKSTILKTQLYNTETVCEDTHVTFQVRKLMKQRVFLCEDAMFFLDPIESLNKLYTQRQRWQRGELEVAHMFLARENLVTRGLFQNFVVRLIMFDHTFAFPRMIWYFALICLVFMNYPMKLVIGSLAVIYLLYVFTSFLYYLNVLSYLKAFEEIKRYYANKWYIIPLLPFYTFAIFWMRFAGIINSVDSSGVWKTRTITEEHQDFITIVRKDFSFLSKLIQRLGKVFNNEKQ